jgi:hypothetical protein
MTLRRVRIEDDGGAYVEPSGLDAYDADEAQSSDWCDADDRREAEIDEREEADRAAMVEIGDSGEYEDARLTDLGARDAVPSPRQAPQRLTEAQAHLRDQWAHVGRDEIAEAVRDAGVLGASVGFKEDLSAESASVYLRRHDPQRTAAGVRSEVMAALAKHGLNIDDRAGVFAAGRPSAERIALKARWREALRPMYEDRRSRVLMCDALGCKRPALHGLMTR